MMWFWIMVGIYAFIDFLIFSADEDKRYEKLKAQMEAEKSMPSEPSV